MILWDTVETIYIATFEERQSTQLSFYYWVMSGINYLVEKAYSPETKLISIKGSTSIIKLTVPDPLNPLLHTSSRTILSSDKKALMDEVSRLNLSLSNEYMNTILEVLFPGSDSLNDV